MLASLEVVVVEATATEQVVVAMVSLPIRSAVLICTDFTGYSWL